MPFSRKICRKFWLSADYQAEKHAFPRYYPGKVLTIHGLPVERFLFLQITQQNQNKIRKYFQAFIGAYEVLFHEKHQDQKISCYCPLLIVYRGFCCCGLPPCLGGLFGITENTFISNLTKISPGKKYIWTKGCRTKSSSNQVGDDATRRLKMMLAKPTENPTALDCPGRRSVI
jgi:hypothetical protein